MANADLDLENDGVPSVNRKKGSNKLVTILGFAFIVAAGFALMLVSGNKDRPKKKEKVEEVAKVSNTMPPIDFQADLPTPPAPEPIQLKNGKPVPRIDAGQQPMRPGEARTAANHDYADPIPVQGGATPKPELSWFERKRLAGTAKGAQQQPQQQQRQERDDVPVAAMPMPTGRGRSDCSGDDCEPKKQPLAAKLEPTLIKAVSASILPNRDFLLTKGTSLDCALETAIDSTQPGITTCTLSRDVFSDNSHVLLLDKGSQLVGEYQGDLKLGQARIFVLWTRAKTPNGVVVSLNAPSTDALGRSGLDGFVDTKFKERFGAAILVSLIKDTTQAVLARSQNQNTQGSTVVYGNTAGAGEKIAEKALDGSVNIPPTLTKNQGEHIQIMVAGDIDFSNVYELKLRK